MVSFFAWSAVEFRSRVEGALQLSWRASRILASACRNETRNSSSSNKGKEEGKGRGQKKKTKKKTEKNKKEINIKKKERKTFFSRKLMILFL